MNRQLAVQAAAIYGPLALAAALYHVRRPSRREAGIALLGTLWTVAPLLALNQVAATLEWWTFPAPGIRFLGMPPELLIGWALLWGAIPVLAGPRLPSSAMIALLAIVDLLVMPRMEPVVVLGPAWLLGEALALGLILWPSILLTRWTVDQVHLAGRAALGALGFTGVMLGVIPSSILARTGGSWAAIGAHPPLVWQLGIQALAVPLLLAGTAVQEFVERGGGTPLPFDPPQRLVATGVYAYLRNPMQAGVAVAFLLLGLLVGSFWVGFGGMVAVGFSSGLAAWHERQDLSRRLGTEWNAYRAAVPAWLPRWRPLRTGRVATLWVDTGCGPCHALAQWFLLRNPVGLVVRPAAEHPSGSLTRLTYATGEGPEEGGVRALARAFDHLNFAWMLVGAFLRLPVVRGTFQLLVDASGGEPRRATTCSAHHPAS